jgi:hypothetical protein
MLGINGAHQRRTRTGGGSGSVFFGKKKLYAEGAQTVGQVLRANITPAGNLCVVAVRVKFPDGSTTELHKEVHDEALFAQFYPGGVVPVRYSESDYSKVAIDFPAIRERAHRQQEGEQAQLDAQFASLGGPGSQGVGGPVAEALAGVGDGGDLKAKLLRMAAQNPGSVIDLRSSQPQAGQGSDPVDRLAKLADLKERGVLTEAEFEAQKAKILGES